jgi:AAA domain
MSSTFAELMEPVARRLLGDPNKKLSKKDDLRYGTKGSLSIDLKKGTFFDHEIKAGGGVLDLIRREHEGDALEWLRGQGLIKSDTIVATFDYRDEKGELLFQVCRTDAKGFKQRRPNGAGDWIWKLEGVRRVPYRLPELIAGAGTVFIPEGEKHVDALRTLGLRATCNSGGAGNWRPEYSEFLRGADVVVLPDNDPPGQKHAQTIALNLHSTASRVRVLALPDLKPKGDVINWLDAGGTVDELVRLAAQAPDWTAPTGDRLIQSSAEFVANYVPPDYLIDGLIQRRYLYSLTGPTGSGKTCVVMRVAAHVALGLSLDGKELVKSRVLFFAGENPDDVRSRWIKLCEEMGQTPSSMDVFFLPGTPAIGNQEIRKRIDAEAEKQGPFGLLIVDTSAAYFLGDDENSNAQLGAHARMLRTFVNLPDGPTVIVTCHPTKNPNMDNLLPRGGGAFIAEVDGNLVCQKEPGSMVVAIDTHGKFRGPEFEPIAFKLQAGQTDLLKDRKGRRIWTVTAKPITEAERVALVDTSHQKQDQLLALMKAQPKLSIAEQAMKLGWFTSKGEPYRSLVTRTRDALFKDKLVERVRGDWVVTKAGAKAAVDWTPAQAEMVLPQAEDGDGI